MLSRFPHWFHGSQVLPRTFSRGSCKKTRSELLLLRPFYKVEAWRKLRGLRSQLKTKLTSHCASPSFTPRLSDSGIPPLLLLSYINSEKQFPFLHRLITWTHPTKHTCHVSLHSTGFRRGASAAAPPLGPGNQISTCSCGLRLREQQGSDLEERGRQEDEEQRRPPIAPNGTTGCPIQEDFLNPHVSQSQALGNPCRVPCTVFKSIRMGGGVRPPLHSSLFWSTLPTSQGSHISSQRAASSPTPERSFHPC